MGFYNCEGCGEEVEAVAGKLALRKYCGNCQTETIWWENAK